MKLNPFKQKGPGERKGEEGRRLAYRSKKVFLFWILAAAVTIGIWMDAIETARYIHRQYQSVGVRLTGDGLDQGSIRAALENEQKKESDRMPEVTAWNQAPGQELYNPVLETKITIPAIEIWGDMRQAAPMELLEGSFSYQEDKAGCILDSKSAYKLFGTIHVIGNLIQHGEKAYYIRGVVKTQLPAIFIMDSSRDAKYWNLELVYSNPEQGEMLAKEFLFQNGMSKNAVLVDGGLYGKVLFKLARLPFWMAFFLVFCLWIKKGERISPTAAVLTILLCLFFLKTLGNPFYLPEKWTPTKWSDFDYWINTWEKFLEEMQSIRYLTPNAKDVMLLDQGKSCLAKIGLSLWNMVFLTLGFQKKL